MFTTAGAACFTTGAKVSRIWSADSGTVCVCADEPPTEDAQGVEDHQIVLFGVDNYGAERNVRVMLSPADYQAACDAHKTGKKVSVRGLLEKVGKYWTLMEPHDFTVIPK